MGVCAGAWLGSDEGSVMGVCVGAWLGGDEGSVIGAGAWLGEPPALSLLALSLFLSSSLSPVIHLKVK